MSARAARLSLNIQLTFRCVPEISLASSNMHQVTLHHWRGVLSGIPTGAEQQDARVGNTSLREILPEGKNCDESVMLGVLGALKDTRCVYGDVMAARPSRGTRLMMQFITITGQKQIEMMVRHRHDIWRTYCGKNTK